MSPFRALALTAAFAALPLAGARAQSIYIDFGANSTPGSTYAAAAGVPGEWNEMAMPSTIQPLFGIQGQLTSATWTAVNCTTNSTTDFPNTTGDDEALLDDWINADCTVDQPHIYIDGLIDGEYLLYAYPKADGGGLVNVNTVLMPQGIGSGVPLPQQAEFTGNFGTWVIAVISLSIAPGTTLELRPSASLGQGISGIQLVRIGDTPTASSAYCFGDGTSGPCPCNNVGTTGRGCGNIVYANGALLGASGNASVSNDTLTLIGTQMSGFQSWYFQGTAQDALPFGYGIQCLSGTLVRIGQKNLIGGSSTNPSGVDLPISVKGSVPIAGATRYYQAIYRQANPPCSPVPLSKSNRTNGLTVVWAP